MTVLWEQPHPTKNLSRRLQTLGTEPRTFEQEDRVPHSHNRGRGRYTAWEHTDVLTYKVLQTDRPFQLSCFCSATVQFRCLFVWILYKDGRQGWKGCCDLWLNSLASLLSLDSCMSGHVPFVVLGWAHLLSSWVGVCTRLSSHARVPNTDFLIRISSGLGVHGWNAIFIRVWNVNIHDPWPMGGILL